MNGSSITPHQQKLQALQQLLPEAFAEGKIDWEKLKATLGEDINFSNERYVLNWAGKSDAFKVLQTPSMQTLIPIKNESVHFDTTQHIFIEGENLEVLKILQKSYFGKIKMIYIDPPYNTGNDHFIYPDKFSESITEYEKRVGDTDQDGYMTKDGMFKKNSKENGQYHSNWLNMMMPRLYLAKNLLTQDGVIFVSIDDNEVHNLRLLMNEIFGEENFVTTVIWERAFSPVNLKKHFSENHDYIICFAKNLDLLDAKGLNRKENDERYKNPDNDIRGNWISSDMTVGPVISNKIYEIITPSGNKILPTNGRCWLYTKDKYEAMLADNRIWFGVSGSNTPRVKKFLTEVKVGITPMTIWKYSEVGHSQEAAQNLKKLFGNVDYFDYPKPVGLIKRILELYTKPTDLILDFFAGSGTTAHAVMELNKEDGGNRKFICLQMPELCKEESEAYKAGYKTIADISKERIRRAGKKIHTELEEEKKKKASQFNFENKDNQGTNIDLGFKVFKLANSNFKQWQTNTPKSIEALKQQLELFSNPVNEHATSENMVYELLLKQGLTLNALIEKRNDYYIINNNQMILMLDNINDDIVEKIILEKPQKIIALDNLFNGNDQLKTNTVLQMRDAGIEFKTL